MSQEVNASGARAWGLPQLTRKQTRMLLALFGVFAIAAVGGAVYLYISGAQARAQVKYQDAMKLMKPGYYGQAVLAFDKAIDTAPNLAEAYLERGNAQRILGNEELALADFEKAASIDPNLYLAHTAIGSIYRDRKDLRRAMEAYTRSIASKPNVDAFYERGRTYENLGDHQKAIEDFDRAILEMPEAPAIYRARSLARRNLGDEAGYQADRDKASEIERRH